MIESWILLEIPDFMRQCLRIDPQCLNWVKGDVLVEYKELLLSLAKDGRYNMVQACRELSIHRYDREFLWEVSEYQPGLYQLLYWNVETAPTEEMDPILEIKLGFYHQLLHTHSREELEYLFSRSQVEICSDIQLWRGGIGAAPGLLVYAAESVRDDEDVVWWAVERDALALEYASVRLRHDRKFCAALVNSNPLSFIDLPTLVRYNKAFISELTFIGFTDALYQMLPAFAWNDETIVLKAIRRNAKFFQYASARVQRIPEVAKEAVQRSSKHYRNLHPQVQCDREIALLAVKSDPSNFNFVPNELRRDKEIAIAAIRDAKNYKQLSYELQHDKDVVLRLVDTYPRCTSLGAPIHVEFPIKFWGDRDVALNMVLKLPASYSNVTDDLRMDREIALAAFSNRFCHLQIVISISYDQKQKQELTCAAKIAWVPEPLRHDLEIARAAVRVEPCNYNDLPVEIRQVKELAMLALECSHKKITERQVDAAFLPHSLLDDEEVMSCAIKILGARSFLIASNRLKSQISFVSLLFDHENPVPLKIFREIPAQVWADRELALNAADTMPDILAVAPLYRDNEEIISTVLENVDADPRLDLFSERLASDKKIILKAMEHNNTALRSLKSSELKPAWLYSACERLRATVAQYFSDDIGVITSYLNARGMFATDSAYRCEILGKLSSSLRDSDKIVTMCIRGGIKGESLCHASSRLLGDRKFILKACEPLGPHGRSLPILSALSSELRDDEKKVEAMFYINVDNREFASSRMKTIADPSRLSGTIFDDHITMLQRVSCNEISVQDVSERLKDNKQFALAVFECNKRRVERLHFFSPRLRDDFDVVKLAFEKTVPRLELISERLRDNTELAIMAVIEDVGQLKFVSERVREDCDFIAKLIEITAPHMRSFDTTLIPERLYKNKQKMMEIIKSTAVYEAHFLFEACSPHLRDDLDLARETMIKLVAEARDGGDWGFTDSYTRAIFLNHTRVGILKRALGVFTSASQRLQACPELIAQFKEIHEVNEYIIAHYLPDNLRDSKVFMMVLVHLIPSIFRAASNRLRSDFDVISQAVKADAGASIYALGDQESSKKRVAGIEEEQRSSSAKKF